MLDILEPILKSTKFPQYLKELQAIAEKENRKRKKFYEDLTEQQKAEFINGEVIIHSPVKHRHSVASDNLYRIISSYVILKKLGEVRHEKVLIKLTRNDFEPDICFFKLEKSKHFKPKQMFFPVPNLVVEVLSDSTEGIDRGVKFEDYQLHEVAEYWLVNAETETVEQYILKDFKYELNLKSNSGNIKSSEIEGFEIPIKAIFDEHENLMALQNLLK